MRKYNILLIISVNIALPLLFSVSSVYAGASELGGSGGITPSILTVVSTGDREKFAEDHWVGHDVIGGISDYSYINENKHGDSIVAEGKAVAGNNDYLFDLDLKKEGVGSLLFEFKQFRKYYDGTGGYFANFAPTLVSRTTYSEINRDLFLDIGDLKIEAVMSKDESTKCSLLYELEYRKGAKSLTSWGGITQGGTTRNILPTFLETMETVNKLAMKIDHTTASGIEVSAEQEWEKIRVATQKCNNRTLNLGTDLFTNVRYKYENLNSDIYNTTVRVSKELNEKVFLSIAFLDNYYVGKTEEVITDTLVATYNENHPLNPAKVYQNTVSILPKASFLLLENLLMDAGLKWEWLKTKGTGTYNRDRGNTPTGAANEFVDIKTKRNDNHLGESVGLKYDGLKNMVFYANGEFEQQLRNEDESQRSFGPLPNPSDNFSRNQNILTLDYDAVSGVKWYPIQKANITAEFKYRRGTRDYTYLSTTRAGDAVDGYRGFLDEITYTTYKPLVKFNFRPFKWLACNFNYAFDTTIYGSRTRVADATELSEYRANIYSVGATLTPRDSLYLTLFYQYKEAGTETPANGSGGRGTNVPTYNANVKALNASCSYSPVKDITMRGSYSFSRADNFNDFSNIGLPLGLDNFSQDASLGIEKKIRNDCSIEFKYDFAQYHEDSNGGIDNYEAHLFYTALKMKF